MDKYDQFVKQAENYLRKCKACSYCKNATETLEKDCFRVKCYCNIYNKDVTRHTGFMCEHYVEK